MLNEGDLVEIPIKTVPDFFHPQGAPILTQFLTPDPRSFEECRGDASSAEDLSEISMMNCNSQESPPHRQGQRKGQGKGQGKGQTTLYMYRVVACCADVETERVVHRCLGCLEYLKGLNRTAFSLLTPLPDEVLNTRMGMVLREKEDVECVTEYLGKRVVSDSDLYQMQRFHRGVLCWETDEDYSRVREGEGSLSHFISSIPPSSTGMGRETVTPPEEWAESGGNSWYCLLPLSDSMTGPIPHTSRSSSSDGASDRLDLIAMRADSMSVFSTVSSVTSADSYTGAHDGCFTDPVLWSKHLKKCADEAQILSHNLRMQRLINIRSSSSQSTRDVFGDPIRKCSKEQVTNMLGKIVSKGAGGLFLTAATRKDAGHLADVMKVVKETHVTTPSESYTAAPCSCCAPTEDGEEREVCVFVREAERASREDRGHTETTYREITYLEHMSSRHPEYKPFLRSLSSDPNHVMLKMINIADKLTLAPLLGTVKAPLSDAQRGESVSASQKLRDQCCACHTQRSVGGYASDRPALDSHNSDAVSQGSHGQKRYRAKEESSRAHKNHSHALEVMLAPEFCRVIGEARWYYCGLSAPSVVWRIQSLLLAVEAREVVVQLMDDFSLANPLIWSPMGTHRDYEMDLPGNTTPQTVLPYHAVLCCSVPCYAMLYSTVPYCSTLSYPVVCCSMLCHTVLCCCTPCCTALCHDMPCNYVSCHIAQPYSSIPFSIQWNDNS